MPDGRDFLVGITPDVINSKGELDWGGVSLDLLDEAPGIEYRFIRENKPVLSADQVSDLDAILSFGSGYSSDTFSDPHMRLSLIARFGVGYDRIDVSAATAAGVMLTITPDGVRRAVATSILTYILALSHKLLIKDRLVRSGRWSERIDHIGVGLTGRTIGIIGVGNIGREFCKVVCPLDVKLLGHDPYVRQPDVEELGIKLVDLDTLMRESDFVCVNCPLTDDTFHLLGEREISMMKPTSFLVNTARGPIVDETALYSALSDSRIAGAGLDVFETEPASADNPIFQLDNVIVTPHAICWTDEAWRKMEESAIRAILTFARGEAPPYIVNQEVLEHPRLRKRMAELTLRRN